jgi:pyruvate formate lyase activating enzyme
VKKCQTCGREIGTHSHYLPICIDCLRSGEQGVANFVKEIHRQARKPFGLVSNPPRESSGLSCELCINQCKIPEGGWGFCGLRTQNNGVIQGVSPEKGNLSWYYDGLPTNCVADWVCPGGTGSGYPKFSNTKGPEYGFKNLAVFYHGCSFDCLFCQNWTHKQKIRDKERISPEELASYVDEKTSCICYFGGDPTPQLPHAIKTSQKAIEKSKGKILRICWETNGSMNPLFLEEMVELSLSSGGCIKFDIKAFNENLHKALCGVSNLLTKKNFERIAQWISKRPEPPLLIASTLLIPGYIDENEIRDISRWIASLNPNIPYALLGFYPQFFFNDLPTTSRTFAFKCKDIAEKEGLRKVRIGNLHLLK